MKRLCKTALSLTAAVCLLAGGIPAGLAVGGTDEGEDASVRQRKGFSHTYPTAYADWENGFLSGNGKMGIIVFGDPLNDTVVYNDRGFNKAASTNTPTRTFNDVPQETLDAIKKACVEGDFQTANDLANEAHGWKDGGDGNRHPGYKMTISIPEDGEVTDYSRVCDYTTGEIAVNWTDNRGDWTRLAFVSREDDVVVQQLTAPTEGKLTCSVSLGIDPDMKMFGGMTFSQNTTTTHLNFRAKYGSNTDDAGYEGVTRVTVTGGSVRLEGDTLVVEDADELLLLTQTEKYRSDSTAEFEKGEIAARLDDLPTDYATLLQRHAAIHTEIYNRVSVDYHASEEERALSNEELLALQKTTELPVKALYERLFDAGRYYFLCSGYEEAVADLGGIWAGDTNAGWGGFYHLDANLNLQIAGGVIGDMPEVMEGYFHLNEAWEEDFQTNAQKLLGCRGLLAAGNTPGAQSGLISALSYYYPYQYVTGEEAWLLYPFWEYYQVTGDMDFLENRFYPLLRQMGDFYEDFLTETEEDGTYIFAGSISPENQPAGLGLSLVNNSTFDISSARFALETLIKVCNLLGTEQGEDGGVALWSAMLERFPEYRINEDGALAEWAWNGLEDNYGHRHSSHLVGVWPYREITPEADPELYDAAVVALQKKDANYTGLQGHGVLHAALNAAGLKNAESVGYRLHQLATEDFYYDSLASSHDGGRQTFCTDTCNTLPAIMMEMLISSDEGVLEFLPALPEGLESGSISGVKGRNRTTIEDLQWDMDAGTVTATIRSDIDQTLTLIERQGIRRVESDAVVRHSTLGQIAREITLKAGESTTVTLYLDESDETGGNLAQGKPAYSSTNDDPTRTPDQAVDGNYSTRWSSGQFDDSWIYVDLGATYDIGEVVLEWEAAYAKSYKLQVSDDASTWTDVYSTTGGQGGRESISVDARGRYVRMLGSERVVVNGSKWGYSLYEFEVYEKDSSESGNLVAFHPATASSEGEGTLADNAADGDKTTLWRSGDEAQSTLTVDLGGTYALSSVTLIWSDPYATAYTLQISGDGADWQDLYSTQEGSGSTETLSVEGEGRYLRLNMAQSSGSGYALAEMEAYGISTAPQPADKSALRQAIAWPVNEQLYTPETWTAYQTALEAAREVANDSDAVQADVDEALENLLQARDALAFRYLGETIGRFSPGDTVFTANGGALGCDWVQAEKPFSLLGKDLNQIYLLVTVTLTNGSDADDEAAFATGKLRLGSPENDVAYDIASMNFDFHEGENVLYFRVGDYESGNTGIDWSQITRFRMYIDSLNKYPGECTMQLSDIQIIDTSVPQTLLGDVDGRDGVTSADALLALQAATGKVELTGEQETAADVDTIPGVTSADALLILQYATEKIDAFPVGEEETMPKLQISVGDRTFSATLYENETTQALLDMLPASFAMSELGGNEKYVYLPEKLPTAASQPGQIQAGDLMLYGDDCLVLFYESFPTSYSYTSLGQIDDPSGLAQAVGTGEVTVSFQIG